MGTWAAVRAQAPELADEVRAQFERHVHHVLATVRADGSPRLSGTEVRWRGEDLVLASMGGSWKSRELAADGRVALMAQTADPPEWAGDVRVTGRAVQITDPALVAAFTATLEQPPPGAFELFRVDVTELLHTRMAPEQDAVLLTSWREGRGLKQARRQ